MLQHRGSNIRALILPFIIGIVLGIIAKFTDRRDFLYYFPLFADLTGRFGIWVWAAALIAVRSKKPLLAATRCFAFFFRNVTCILWLYCSVFAFFSEVTNDLVGRYRYGYSVLRFSDMAYTQNFSHG